MSQISKALKKVQDSRQHQEEKLRNIVYLSDSPKPWPFAIMIILAMTAVTGVCIGALALTLTMKNSESKQIQVLKVEKSISMQSQRINELISAINKNQKFTDNQIYGLKGRLNQETSDVQHRINDLATAEGDQYSNLKEAILDDKEKIDNLDQRTQGLKQSIDGVIASETKVPLTQ